jgi:glycine dehydrogenase subunit 1
MPYIPTTESQKAEMLASLGLKSTAELFREIPEDVRFPDLGLEEGRSEAEVMRELAGLAAKNGTADKYLWFLGAGAYDHFVPAAVGALASRGEFLTSYTPYQPEVSQGTLQAMFEYQSLVADLTGMDVANAGHYDGATALAEAVLMALRQAPDRRLVLLPSDLHPEYLATLETYLQPIRETYSRPGGITLETYTGSPAEAAAAAEDLVCLVAAYPGFTGLIPDLEGAAEAVHGKGGLFIVQADPIMLGLFKSPGEWGADIAVCEGQSLGNDLNYGGPYLGVMAVTSALMRKIPGRIAGETVDHHGRRSFVLTLSAREQHIRREKALSNICSNQGLAALRAAIYLALLGKTGLARVASLCWHKAHYAAKRIAELPGFSVAPGTFFKEFEVMLDDNIFSGRLRIFYKSPVEALADSITKRGIVPGLPLSRYYPGKLSEEAIADRLARQGVVLDPLPIYPENLWGLLVCVTEKHTREDIDALVTALKEGREEIMRLDHP